VAGNPDHVTAAIPRHQTEPDGAARRWNSAAPPDHGLINLLASLERGLGCENPLNPAFPLPALPPEAVSRHTHVLFWLIDGFALDYLNHTPALRTDLFQELETVFPSTTASAITSVFTGVSPAQHGLLGWRTYLPHPQRTLTVLPAREADRGGNSAGLSTLELQSRIHPPLLVERLPRQTTVISPAAIAHSSYNCLMSGSARVMGFQRLEELPALLGAHVRASVGIPQYTYFYWSHLDHLGHECGPDSAQVRAHLSEIDAVYARILRELEGTGALFLTSTDHGMRTVSQRLDIRQAPGVSACLRHPLTGEPRAALAHVKPGRHQQFRNAIRNTYGSTVELIEMNEWLSGRAFGPGRPHPELQARAGDYLLFPDPDSYLVDPAGDDTGPEFRGAHGGLTREERQIPLFRRAFGSSPQAWGSWERLPAAI